MNVSPGGGYIQIGEYTQSTYSGGGYIQTGNYTPSSYPDTIYYDSGSVAKLEAVPDFGHVFDGWSGDLSGTDNPAVLLIDCDKNVTANFSVNWLLVGGAIGGGVLLIAIIAVLIVKIRTTG